MNNQLSTTTEQDLLQQWQELNGATPYVEPNTIKFVNGAAEEDYGTLYAKYTDESGQPEIETIDIEKAEFTFIMAKVYIKAANFGENGPEFRTKEISHSGREEIVLVDSEKNELARGLYADLKEQGWKDKMKYSENAYVEYNGRVFRWNLGGAQLGSWFKIKNKLNQRPHTFKISSIEDKKSGATRFKALHFEIGNPVDVKKAIELRRELEALFGGHTEAETTAPGTRGPALEEPAETTAPGTRGPALEVPEGWDETETTSKKN